MWIGIADVIALFLTECISVKQLGPRAVYYWVWAQQIVNIIMIMQPPPLKCELTNIIVLFLVPSLEIAVL